MALQAKPSTLITPAVCVILIWGLITPLVLADGKDHTGNNNNRKNGKNDGDTTTSQQTHRQQDVRQSNPKELSRYNATVSFEWRASRWTECKYRDRSSCCDCYRHRNVSCIRKGGGTDRVPPFYCRKLLPVTPHREEKCAPCRQPCVMAMWGAWSDCSATCSPALRYRTRAVLLPSSHGGKGCGDLLEVKPCDRGKVPCSVLDPRPPYKWTVLPWTSCRKPNNTRTCGQGLRTRGVRCVTKEDHVVSALFCRHHLTDLKPPDTEPCDPSCDCRVSHWSSWGPCSVTCRGNHGNNPGYQVRTRSIKHVEEHGGLTCPHLREMRTCRDNGLPECPTYVWYLGSWQQCSIPGKPSECGSGLRHRDVICVRQGDADLTPVSDVLCMQDLTVKGNTSSLLRPTSEAACKVSCPTDCELGEWQNWSSCTHSCGTGGTRVRQKPILMRSTRGGAECGERYENKPCEQVACQWWHAGQWTRCFLPTMFDPEACGTGTQVRNVYCLNSLDEVLQDDRCSDLEKPPTQQPCRVPCTDDCRVSVWTNWGTCSVVCGPTGGLQTRTRTILSNGTSGAPCLREDELRQSRVCNQRPCRQYLWQGAPWSPCVRTADASAPCGNGTGAQTRRVHCEMDPGYHVNNSLCDQHDQPTQVRTCSAPCPQDCKLDKWTPWSACSHTCGSHSYKLRTRTVIHLAMYGGTACPPQANHNGVIVQKKRCKRVPECHTYQWESSSWSACQMEASCGHGVQRRNISCVRTNDQKVIKEDACYELTLGPPPQSELACFLPCDGDCELSPWSNWASCSQSCGVTAGIKTRTRFILKLDSGLDALTQCPHLGQADLVESLECGYAACPNFTWVVGDWGSCIVHNVGVQDELLPCGDGVRRRHVLCQRSDGAQVPHHHCDVISMTPDKHEACSIACQKDCQMGVWTEWGPCTQPCGEGVKTRTRAALAEAEEGGRPCVLLEENTTCSDRDCALFEWKVAPWGPCQPFYGIDCGRGQHKRKVTCRAGAEFESECGKREARPSDTVSCDIPCLGDCVTSQWSEWSECSCRPNATRSRHRNVTKEALPSAHQCGTLEEEVPCYCPLYSIVVGGWTTCVIPQGAGNQCGKGTQRRAANCVREDGITVTMSYCLPEDAPTEQSCDVACPVDCELTKFTPWSHCSAECGLEAYKERLRSVLTPANTWGRKCPVSEYLVQNTTCHTTACYVYTWRHLAWSPCSVDSRGCGVGTRSRMVECVRSDGLVVDEASCFSEDDRENSLNDLDPHERKERDLETEQICGQPCPGDCVVSTWSRYGPCFKDCASPGAISIQVRTRVVLKPATGGRACPSHLMEVRPCRRDEVYCPTFYWKAGEWGPNAARKVSCMAHEHLEVSRGCLSDLRPSAFKHCRSLCGQYARCVDGTCTCMQGFTGDGYTCLPEYGCEDNSHCVVNATYCDVMNKECLCVGGLLPDEALQCPILRVGDGRGLFEAGLSTLVLYIIIGSVCALVILTLICTICLISRRRRKPPSTDTYPNLTKIDNLDSMKKNNQLRGKDIVIIHKFGTADKNLTGSSNYGSPRYQPHTNSYNEGPLKDGAKMGNKVGQICLLDPDDDLFGNHSDSSTKPLVDDPDYIPMYGADTPEGSGSISTNSISPDTSNYGNYGTSQSSLTPSGGKFGSFYGIDERRVAPPLPPPNHTGPRSVSNSPSALKDSNTRHGAMPRSATYENTMGVNTLPRSDPMGDLDDDSSPWQLHQSPQTQSRGQQTLPRPSKKVWFPQAGDKKPSSHLSHGKINNDIDNDLSDRDSEHKWSPQRQPGSAKVNATLQNTRPLPPLKPKPKINNKKTISPLTINLPPKVEEKSTDSNNVNINKNETPSEDDVKYSGDPPRTPNGLRYPSPPPKMEDQHEDGTAGTRLMEYCDELLQELEMMAKA